MLYRLLVAATAVMTLWMTGCGSVQHAPVVLIEPDYSYVQTDANPSAAPVARRATEPAPFALNKPTRGGVSLPASRLP